MRRRRDSVHAAVVADLTRMGCSVADTAVVGQDFPDLVVGKWGITMLVELKSPKAVSRRKGDGRSEGQVAFAEGWRGGPVIVAQTAEEILAELDRRIWP